MTVVHYKTAFPDYEFREYPKWMPTGKDERGHPTGIHVLDEDEELEFLASQQPPVREADEKIRLISVAETKGVQVDKRWSIVKLTQAITDAGFDASLDPNA